MNRLTACLCSAALLLTACSLKRAEPDAATAKPATADPVLGKASPEPVVETPKPGSSSLSKQSKSKDAEATGWMDNPSAVYMLENQGSPAPVLTDPDPMGQRSAGSAQS